MRVSVLEGLLIHGTNLIGLQTVVISCNAVRRLLKEKECSESRGVKFDTRTLKDCSQPSAGHQY